MSWKVKINDRYIVYLHKCSCQNLVIDTKDGKDITNSTKGILLIIEAYNTKNPRGENGN
jgi:hypothetical protein